jgi:L-lactate utilization protein LutB
MPDIDIWHAETLGNAACKALEKNGFDAHYMATAAEAITWVRSLVKPGMTVGTGGSVTLHQLGLHKSIEEAGATLLYHSKKGLSPEEKMEIMRAQLTSDLFLSGTNAITLDGELYNVDANGNRVAALTFGPRKTVVIAGWNKIVRNSEEARARVELQASPQNNRRLDTGNPCAETGYCVDCRADKRICRVYTLLRRRPLNSDFSVLIVGERLGY